MQIDPLPRMGPIRITFCIVFLFLEKSLQNIFITYSSLLSFFLTIRLQSLNGQAFVYFLFLESALIRIILGAINEAGAIYKAISSSSCLINSIEINNLSYSIIC